MRCGFPKRTAVALSIVAILTQSCATLEKRLNETATTQGKAQAGAVLHDWQTTAARRKRMQPSRKARRLDRSLSENAVNSIKQNARTGRCAGFYDDLKSRMSR